MSAEIESESSVTNSCASCGVKESGDIKLKNCTACYLVKYCGVNCQKQHRKAHKRACKKRAAELHDEILFKQPESSDLGDCPICFLPLPIDQGKSMIMTCCSKVICHGCCYANEKREVQGNQYQKCPFCRTPPPSSGKEGDRRLIDRAAKNDPIAMFQLGLYHHKDGDYQGAFQYFSKAVELGNVGAHYQLAILYDCGSGVEKDEPKMLYHYEQAAIGGDPMARHNLGFIELENRRYERAVKHWIIAAKLGFDQSVEFLKMGYKDGFVSKDDLAAAIQGHQSAVAATKSPQREEAAKAKAAAQQDVN